MSGAPEAKKRLRSYGPFRRVIAESIDIKVLTDLKPSFPNPENLANLVNPAHIL